MSAVIVMLRICIIAILSVAYGCGGPTVAVIPDNITALAPGKARIVLVREDQLAGADSALLVVDIGDGIIPNALIHMKDFSRDDILRSGRDPAIAAIASDRLWFWFDAERVDPLFCGSKEPDCVIDHWRWPQREAGSLLYGAVLNVRDNCKLELAYPLAHEHFEAVRKGSLQTVALTGIEGCQEVDFVSNERIQSLIPAVDNFFTGMMFEDYLLENRDGYRMPGVPGYVQFVNIVLKYRSLSQITGGYYLPESIDYGNLERELQVIGMMEGGDTLVWDRKPGRMRLGSAWYDGLGFMSSNVDVEAGKTYYLRYEVQMGERWKLERVE